MKDIKTPVEYPEVPGTLTSCKMFISVYVTH